MDAIARYTTKLQYRRAIEKYNSNSLVQPSPYTYKHICTPSVSFRRNPNWDYAVGINKPHAQEK
jgi:hypothetical protein